MPDPLDAINQPVSKHWWQSKTIWGLIIAGVSIAAPKYQPIAQVLPQTVDQIGQIAGLIIAAYGRIKADKPINTPLPR